MYDIASLDDNSLRQTFLNAANRLGIRTEIVEKDFWVSILIDYLFTKSKYKDMFILKGGTSLSKGYNYINRFSEDIDLVIKYTYFDSKIDEILSPSSSTNHRTVLCERLNKLTTSFVENELIYDIKENFGKLTGRDIDISIDQTKPLTLRFNYPHFFNGKYMLDYIVIEYGSLASLTPTEEVLFSPLLYQLDLTRYPKEKWTPITIYSPVKTFWEKINAIHTNFVKPLSKPIEPRFTRHLFDIYCLGHCEIKQKAFSDISLQEESVNISDCFYHYGWLDLDRMRKRQYQLTPPKERYDEIKADYLALEELIWGKYPSFEDLLNYLQDLEVEISKL